eukprot:957242-Pelagomonas_calceolata.AAC.3
MQPGRATGLVAADGWEAGSHLYHMRLARVQMPSKVSKILQSWKQPLLMWHFLGNFSSPLSEVCGWGMPVSCELMLFRRLLCSLSQFRHSEMLLHSTYRTQALAK